MADELVTSEAGSPTPSPAPAAVAAAPAAPLPATPAAPQAPALGAPTVEPTWLKGRLDETRAAAIRQYEAQKSSEWQSREAQYQSQLNQYKTQLQALVGVTPPQNPEVDAVKKQFSSLYPGLTKIEERAQAIMELIDRSGDLEAQNAHYWQTYGRQTMDRLYGKASESLGAPLTEEGKRALHSSFIGFVQSSPELTQRYETDPSIVEDFWNAFTSNFIDPARRVAASTVVNRAGGVPTPQDTPSGVPQQQAAPKFAGLDERVNAAWSKYNLDKK